MSMDDPRPIAELLNEVLKREKAWHAAVPENMSYEDAFKDASDMVTHLELALRNIMVSEAPSPQYQEPDWRAVTLTAWSALNYCIGYYRGSGATAPRFVEDIADQIAELVMNPRTLALYVHDSE